MSGTRFLCPVMTALDANGDPIPGAKLYFYTNNTTVQKQIYADVNLSVTEAQPVIADGAGRFTADVFLSNESYAIELQDASGTRIWLKNDCNAQIPSASGSFPFPGAVIEFYGTQAQLNVALALYWYVCDGTGSTPNLNLKYTKGCIDVATIGTSGGSSVPTGTVGGTALSIAQLPAHSFKTGVASSNGNAFIYGATTTGLPGSSSAGFTTPGSNTYQGVTETLGSGSTHTHSLTMDSYDPPYMRMIKLLYVGS